MRKLLGNIYILVGLFFWVYLGFDERTYLFSRVCVFSLKRSISSAIDRSISHENAKLFMCVEFYRSLIKSPCTDVDEMIENLPLFLLQ